MRALEHFSVQLVEQSGVENSDCRHVEALSPVQAAQRVLGETLSLFGQPDKVRARVWRMNDDFTPTCVALYSADESTLA